ncbi:hypothetical protein [Modestobacter sp. NPDC049651]|uniref:hypothetical protein n=1 Tax=unclassified Modestobacter TaxID=2643866 RepID=UPI0033D9BECC
MIFVLIAVAWMVLAVAAALVVAGAIRLADRRAPMTDHLAGLPAELTVADIVGRNVTQPQH